MLKIRPKARAFSLIELLVVISIIALLIGILLPALPKVRDQARKAACGAALRSEGQALQMYQSQYKDIFPQARYMPKPLLSSSSDPSLREAMASYMEGDNAYRCPGDKWVFTLEYTEGPATKQCQSSFIFLPFFSGRKFEDTFWFKRMRKTPSESPVSYDFDYSVPDPFELQDGTKIFVPYFHTSRNLLFADGNVGKYIPEADPNHPPADPIN